MWKAIVAGTAALAIGGTSLVYAQQRFGGLEGLQRFRPSAEDMRAFGEARLAALKAGLMLNADQEKNWPAFEQAARDLVRLRLDRMTAARAERRDDRGGGPGAVTDPVQRLRERGTTMADTGAALKKFADAMDPLYKSLDDGQKRRFALLARVGEGGREFGRDGGFRGREDGFRGREDGFRGREGLGSGGFGRDGDGYRGFGRDGDRGFGPRRSDPERRDFRQEFGGRGDGREFDRDFGRRRFERGPDGGFEGSGPVERERNPRRFERDRTDSGTPSGEAL